MVNAAGSVGVKTAASEWGPAASVDVLIDAVPPVTATGVPIAVLPSWNCTEPAAVGVTVAVSVTDVPCGCGLGGVTASVVVVCVAVEGGAG